MIVTLCLSLSSFEKDLSKKLARRFNKSSTAKYLISFKKPKKIIKKWKFQVELVGKFPTSMHGSSERHTCYVYRRELRTSDDSVFDDNDIPCDPLFREAWELCKTGSLDKIHDHVDWKTDVFLQEKIAREQKQPDRLTDTWTEQCTTERVDLFQGRSHCRQCFRKLDGAVDDEGNLLDETQKKKMCNLSRMGCPQPGCNEHICKHCWREGYDKHQRND